MPILLHFNFKKMNTQHIYIYPPRESSGRERGRIFLGSCLWSVLNMSLGSYSATTHRGYAPSIPLVASLGPCLSLCHWNRHSIGGWGVTAKLKHGTFQMIGLSISVL